RVRGGEPAEDVVVQLVRAGEQLLVGGTGACLGAFEAGHHLLDPPLLLATREGGGHQDDDLVAVAVGRDGASSARTPAHLDDRVADRPTPFHGRETTCSTTQGVAPSTRC